MGDWSQFRLQQSIPFFLKKRPPFCCKDRPWVAFRSFCGRILVVKFPQYIYYNSVPSYPVQFSDREN